MNITDNRLLLIFPPRTSPTYAPLGLASLAALVRERCPGTRCLVRDLNLSAWHDLLGETPAGREAVLFFQGRAGDFYDRDQYAGQAEVLAGAGARLAALEERARSWLENGRQDGELFSFLDGQLARLPAAERIGFSLIFPGQLIFALALARRLRERIGPGPLLLLGGALLSALRPRELLEAFPFVDAAVVGEGEPAVLALLNGPAGAGLEGVPGLIWRGPDGIRRNAPGPAPLLADLPGPDYSALLSAAGGAGGGYLNPEPVLTLAASRGCRWRRCRFCAHNASFGPYRCQDPQRVVRQMEDLRSSHGARHFYLADQYVIAPALEALCATALQRGRPAFFHIMARPSLDYTPRLLERAALAGCRWISWGVESGSQRLLDLADKGTRAQDIAGVLERAGREGIANLMMMIFGLPTGGPRDLEATFELIERVYPWVQAMTASAFVLFEGTWFSRQAARLGLRVLGPEVLLHAGGRLVHSTRLRFVREDGEADRGEREVALWTRRRAWLGGPLFMERLPSEHFLLYASRESRLPRPAMPPDPDLSGRPSPAAA